MTKDDREKVLELGSVDMFLLDHKALPSFSLLILSGIFLIVCFKGDIRLVFAACLFDSLSNGNLFFVILISI